MKAEARFANPDEAAVTITLRGTLKEFEELETALWAEKPVPYWQSRALLETIREAAQKLRAQVAAERDCGGGTSDSEGIAHE